MVKVTFKIEEDYLELLDHYVNISSFKNRSDAIRFLVKELLIQRGLLNEKNINNEK